MRKRLFSMLTDQRLLYVEEVTCALGMIATVEAPEFTVHDDEDCTCEQLSQEKAELTHGPAARELRECDSFRVERDLIALVDTDNRDSTPPPFQ